MKLEVYIINLCLALIFFSLLMWKLRKLTSTRRRTIISLLGGIALAPIAYVTIVAVFFFGFLKENSNNNNERDQTASVSSAKEEITFQHRDTAVIEQKVADMVKRTASLVNKHHPYSITIEHSGFEDGYTENWFFDDNFELKRTDYTWGGESFSGNGSCLFYNNRLMLKIDTSRDEGYKEAYTYYSNQVDSVGGIRYDNLIQVRPDGTTAIEKTAKEIMTKADFEKEEKAVLLTISNHLNALAYLRTTARFIDNIIELKKIDTIKHTTAFEYADITIYSMDTLLFNSLLKKNK